MVKEFCYRDLTKYKYQTTIDFGMFLSFNPQWVLTNYINIVDNGYINIKKGYAWDGPSGPTIDTKSFMRGSLVHDALYQLMREGYLDYKKYRKLADQELRRICLEDGMSKFRAWYVYRFVRLFGKKNAKPTKKEQDKITCIKYD